MTADTLLLLLRSDTHRVTAWLRRGSVPAYVVPVGGWTAVVPAGAEARTSAPYDKSVPMLTNRPIPSGLRAALCFAVIDARAVLVVHPPGWRAVPRWLIWQTGQGPSGPTPFPAVRPADLVNVAGIVREDLPHVEGVLRDTALAPDELLHDLIDALGLPGAELLEPGAVRHASGAALVEPDERSVRRFEKVTREERDIAEELKSS
ncbi:hypothetical protein ATK17_1537 [Branchiibius hedensis]|uniref:Uncharacterized protein n=1 Tax=Branchiibius hedensis TaxID=672460 RepID=A0A2Y8ZPH3_9MICO|nr:hypothetical protein [Branchiibius hedensis]PWJ25417.1 hypothetical protein ATK17_1537 [Branchiibius hedensis]SSA34230.1 hypothetical protein SAMN04489750_1537 [Branchiibius hedensis]